MSFRQSWKTIEQRTIAFLKGAGDDRTSVEICEDIIEHMESVADLFHDKNLPDPNLPGFTQAEKHLACVMTDLAYLSAKNELDVSGAMIARNTRVRTAWREELDCSKSSLHSDSRKRDIHEEDEDG